MAEETLLKYLLDLKAIKEDQVDSITKRAVDAKQSVEDFLIANSKVVGEEELTQARAKLYNIPYIDLTGKAVEPDVLRLIPEKTAEHYHVIAFQRSETEVNVGIEDPRNFKALEAVEFLMKEHGVQPYYYMLSEGNFKNILKTYSGLGDEVEEVLDIAKEKFAGDSEGEDDVDMKGDVVEVIKKAPVSKIVSIIIAHAVESRASDIHIEPFRGSTRIRYRIDGILQSSLTLPEYLHSSIVTRVKVLADLQLDETRKPQDGRIRLKISKNKEVDLRVSSLPLVGKEKIVLRILDTSGKVLTLKELGYTEKNVKLIEDSMHRSHGLFLVTGPTGAGKSTTLYSVLNILNNDGVNIITLENPAEFYIPGVNQSQVNAEVGFTFSSGLRAMLRQDPDIMMVGEIRDAETAELAIHATLTGHLMFSTLHTSDALGSMPRLIDMGMEPYLLASTLGSVIAQRLVRRICEYCKVDITLPKELEEKIRATLGKLPKDSIPKELADKKPLVFFKGNGCVRCGDTGYKGRTSIAEVIVVDEAFRAAIADGAKHDVLQKAAFEQGMIGLQQDGFLRALKGKTTVDEVLRVMQE